MRNLNPIYLIEGGIETAIAATTALAGTGLPQRMIAKGVQWNQARKARQQARIAAVMNRPIPGQQQADSEGAEEAPQETPYSMMQRQNRQIIHTNAFPD